jgi:hypothetical protein
MLRTSDRLRSPTIIPLIVLFLLVPSALLHAAQQDYVGSTTCLSCHDSLSRDWP